MITNPNAMPFYVSNFNDTVRDVLGLFVERGISLSDNTGLDIGVRYNRVSMDSELVSANLNPMNMMGMPAAMNNMADRKSTRLNSSHVKRSRMPSSA